MESSSSLSKIVYGFACSSCCDEQRIYKSLYLNPNSWYKHSSANLHFTRYGCQIRINDPTQPARQSNLCFIRLDPCANEKNCGQEVPNVDNVLLSNSNLAHFNLFKSHENVVNSKSLESRSKDGKKNISFFCKEVKIEEHLFNSDLRLVSGEFEFAQSVQDYFTKAITAFSTSGPEIQSLICGYPSQFAVSPALMKERLSFVVHFMFLLEKDEFILPEWELFDGWDCFIHFFLDEVSQGPIDSVDSPQLLLRKRVFYHMLHLELSFSFPKLIDLISTFKYFIFIARFIKFSSLVTERSEAQLQKLIAAEPVFNFAKILKLWKTCVKRLALLHGGAFIPQIFVFDNPNNPEQIVIGTCVYPSDLVGRMFQQALERFNSTFEKLCILLPFPGTDLNLVDPCSRINSDCIVDDFSHSGPFYRGNGSDETNRKNHDAFLHLLFESCSLLSSDSITLIENLMDDLFVICLTLLHVSCGSPGRVTDYSSLSFYGPARNLFFLQGHAFSVLANSKIEKMTQRSSALIVRSFPKEVSDIFAKLCIVIRPLQVCVKLLSLADNSLREKCIENSVLHSFLNRGGEPFANVDLIRYRLNKELLSLAKLCVVDGDSNNATMHIRIFRQLIAWTLNHRVVKGGMHILDNSLQTEINSACGRILRDLPLLHSLLVVNFVPEFARQGGRSEQAYYHNYGHNHLNIESNGRLVSSALISEGFAISKLAHLTLLSLNNEKIIPSSLSPSLMRKISFPSFENVFGNDFKFLMVGGSFDQKAFSSSYYDCIVHHKNALVIAPTGCGKTQITLKILLSASGNKIFIVILPSNVTIAQFIDRADTIQFGSALRLGDFVQSLSSSAVNAQSLLDPSCISSPFRILVCTPEALMQHSHFVNTRLLCFNLIESIIWDDCHDGGEKNSFRPAFNCVSSMFSSFDKKEDYGVFPSMICLSGSISYSEERSFLRNLFQPSFLSHHGVEEEPLLIRSGATIGNKHGWFLSLAAGDNLLERSLLYYVFNPSLVGDIIVFVPDDETGLKILSLLSHAPDQSSMVGGFFEKFLFVSRKAEQKSGGTLLSSVNAAMSHLNESNPNAKRSLLISTQICGPGADFCNVNTVIIFKFSFSVTSALQSGGRCGRNGKSGKVILICDPAAQDPMKDILWKDMCLRRSLSNYFDGIEISSALPANCNNCTFCLGENFHFLNNADFSTPKNDYSKRQEVVDNDYNITPFKKGKTAGEDNSLNVADAVNLSDSEVLVLALPYFGSPKFVSPLTFRFAKFLLHLKDHCLFAACNEKHSFFGECSLLPKKLCFGCGFFLDKATSPNGKWCLNGGRCAFYSPSKKDYICFSCFTHCTLKKAVCSANTAGSPRILFRLVLHLCHVGSIDFAKTWKQIFDYPKDVDRFQFFQNLFNEANAKCGGRLRVSLWN